MTLFDTLRPDGSPIFLANLPVVRGRGQRPYHQYAHNEAELLHFIARYDRPGRSLYFTVATLKEGTTRSKETVQSACWVWAEVDFKDHPGVPPEEILRRIQAAPLPPTLIVASGHGYHLYWRLNEPLDAAPGKAQQDLEEGLKLACRYVGGDTNATEAARLLRLPRSCNRKDGGSVPVEIVSENGHHYELSDLVEFWREALPILPEPIRANGHSHSEGGPHTASEYTGPVDVEQRFADMRFKGPGDTSVHRTELQTTGSLIRCGCPVDDVVATVLEAVRKCVSDNPDTANWNWTEEELAVRGMCTDLINKNPELSGTLPDDLREPFEAALVAGKIPKIVYARHIGWHVRSRRAKADTDQQQGNRASQSDPKLRRPKIYSSQAFTEDFKPPDYLVDGLLQFRFIYACTAMTGHGKTTLMLLLAACIALKKMFAGHSCEQGRVIVLAGENPDDVRMRWIGLSEYMKFDRSNIDVSFIPGVFPISQIRDVIAQDIKQTGREPALIIVDTSAAYFSGNDENSNVQLGHHARSMREYFISLPGGPCVIITNHPTKSPDMENLLPRGGGSYVAEVDGNLVIIKTDKTASLHWHGKFRGVDFEPATFELVEVRSDSLVDSKGRHIPTIVAKPLDETEQGDLRRERKVDEDHVLVILLDAGEEADMSLVAIAERAGWTDRLGLPHKRRARTTCDRLRKAKLVRYDRDTWMLTDGGEKAALRAKGRAKGL